MRYELAAAYLRAVRETRTHSLGDRAHRQALQLRQNVALEVDAIERSVIEARGRVVESWVSQLIRSAVAISLSGCVAFTKLLRLGSRALPQKAMLY
jgi:hypothetical protein